MLYREYELTDKEQEEFDRLNDDELSIGSNGWDYKNGRSYATSYAINLFGQDVIQNWTEQKLDAKLKEVIRKTAFNIIKKIPFEIKKQLFLQYKGAHHKSNPQDNQTWYDTLESLYGISNYLLAHKLTINEAKKLFQLSLDVQEGKIKLKNDFSECSRADFIDFIG